MTWVKLDDGFSDHLKVDGLSDGAFRLHVSAMCYCARNLTDGAVERGRPLRLIPRFKQAFVAELVDAGLWDAVDGGWSIHDYLVYNPSRAKVLAEREAAAERQRKARDKRSESRRDKRQTNGTRSAAPTRPVGERVGTNLDRGEAATTAPAASGSAVEIEEQPLDLAESARLAAQIRADLQAKAGAS